MNSNFTYYVKMFLKRDKLEISQLNSSQLPEQSLRHQNLKAIISFLLLFVFAFSLLMPGNVSAQTNAVTIKGVVLDDQDGSPLPGVGITDSQKKGLGVTNARGEFSITVPKGTQVQFSFIGSATETRTFTANQTGVSIRLKPENKALTEVVVTALGIKREEKSLGYSATTVSGTQLTDAPAANWTDALAGKVAGLNLTKNSGPTGSNKIILRGENNLTGDNEALIIIDGVVASSSSKRTGASSGGAYATSGDNLPTDFGSGLNDLNPEDIESVTVLKGPGAAALYGQRGANGAIIITTKSGNVNKKRAAVSFTHNTVFDQINRTLDRQSEFGQGTEGVSYYSWGASADGGSVSGTSSAWGAPFGGGQMYYQYDPVTKKQGTVRTPWISYGDPLHDFFRIGNDVSNSASVDGTLGTTTLRASINHGENSWIVPNTGYERTSAQISANAKLTQKLSLNLKAIYNNKFSDNLPGTGYGNQSLMYWYIFSQPNINVDWYKDYWQPGFENERFSNLTTSFPEGPYAITEQYLNGQRRNGIIGNAQANYKFTKELSLMVRGSIDKSRDKREQKRPWDAAGNKFAQGSYRVQNIDVEEVNADFMLQYNKNLSKDVKMNVNLGGSMLKNRYYREELRADGLKVPAIYSLDNALNQIISLPDTARYNINSFYGSAAFGYKNYLYLDITGRQDWNSVLATPSRTDNVGFFYPSANISFIASDYFKLPKSVSFAKLRFSASQVGSGLTTPYRTAYNYGVAAGGIYGDAVQNPGTLPNFNLKPLKTTTYELGADVRLFKSRLGFDIALYAGNTKNQILSRRVDPASGYTNQIVNVGRVDNQGIEIAVNGKPIAKKNGFNWSSNITFSANTNEIKELADSSFVLRGGPLGNGQIVAKVGGSMGDIYGWGYQRSPDGQIIFNAEGNAEITNEVIHLGNALPKFKIGFQNSFNYKGFNLSTLFDAQVGAVAHSLTFSRMAASGKNTVTLPGRYNGIIGNGVQSNGDGTYRPNDVIAVDIDNYYNSIYGSEQAEGSIFSTDFIKFREATLGYTFKKRVLETLGVSRLSLSVYGRNLFIWTPWPAFDPEFGTLSGGDITTGFEIGQLPSTRSFGVRLVLGVN